MAAEEAITYKRAKDITFSQSLQEPSYVTAMITTLPPSDCETTSLHITHEMSSVKLLTLPDCAQSLSIDSV